MKAGLTGYAQVYGKYNTTAYDKLKLDLMYIQNYNIRLDFEIMFKTVQILFIRESTEGMEAGQFIALTKEQEGIYEMCIRDSCEKGRGLDFNEELAKEILDQEEVEINVTLQEGSGNVTCWGCDLTYDYVKINGDYRT